MKILQISNRVPWPLNEGGTLGIYNYTRSFSNLGHEVTLYCLDGLKHNTPVKEAEQALSKYATTYIHPINTDIVAADAFKSLLRNESYNVKRFFNAVFQEEIVELIKREKFDIIQLEGTFTGPYVDAIKNNYNGLLVLRMHNVEYEIWERLAINEKNPLKKVYLNTLAKQLKAYEKDLLNKIDVVVPVTDADSDKFKALNPRIKVFTSPAGINLEEWQFAPSTSYYKWYHIGSMEWHANKEAAEWFITAIHPLLASEFKEYVFYLAGKGLDAYNFNQIDKLVVESNVPKAFDFVCKQDVCVVPLKSGSGIRVKILEAMAAGKLVISTSIGAQGIPYVNGEHLLIADTPQQFLEAYRNIQNGTIDVHKIVLNARKLIEDAYSTDAITRNLADFYSSEIKA